MEAKTIKFTFVAPGDSRHEVEGIAGESVMEVAYANAIEGVVAECGGSMSCGTCHVYLDDRSFAEIDPPSDNENDMLDIVSSERRPTSRLSCQVLLTDRFAGAEVTIPASQF